MVWDYYHPSHDEGDEVPKHGIDDPVSSDLQLEILNRRISESAQSCWAWGSPSSIRVEDGAFLNGFMMSFPGVSGC